ncbi:MAG: TonB-system energizer ExbB [Helicobacteraceae bacterium]|nr:TonB-system energizer ExbB [Helicobacteraceae bacterium]
MTIKDYLEYGILGFLVFLSIIVLALIMERIWTFRKIDYLSYCDRKKLEIDLTKNLTLIATIGTNAPYIGLLGTVGGIMLTFIEIGQNNALNTGDIMIGLALALKATALGLIVAIPAIVGYNLLVRKSEVLLMLWDMEKNRNDFSI